MSIFQWYYISCLFDKIIVHLFSQMFISFFCQENFNFIIYALIFYKSSNLPALLFCLDNEI